MRSPAFSFFKVYSVKVSKVAPQLRISVVKYLKKGPKLVLRFYIKANYTSEGAF